MRRSLERQAARLGVEDSVVFLGSRPPEEVALWMNVAECLCLPSRNEGCPNVVLEALASGLPVVASDVGACRELLCSHGGNTVLPPAPGEGCQFVEAMATAVSAVLGEGSGGRRARTLSGGTRTWRDMAAGVLSLIDAPSTPGSIP